MEIISHFQVGHHADIRLSGEMGTITGIAQFVNEVHPAVCLLYSTDNGLTDDWFPPSALAKHGAGNGARFRSPWALEDQVSVISLPDRIDGSIRAIGRFRNQESNSILVAYETADGVKSHWFPEDDIIARHADATRHDLRQATDGCNDVAVEVPAASVAAVARGRDTALEAIVGDQGGAPALSLTR